MFSIDAGGVSGCVDGSKEVMMVVMVLSWMSNK